MKRSQVTVGLLLAGAALTLSGCYTAPAEPYYAYPAQGYYAPTYYGPGYYAPRRPVQNTFVFSYTDRDRDRGRGDRRSHRHGRWD